jgi:hypothetical protein
MVGSSITRKRHSALVDAISEYGHSVLASPKLQVHRGDDRHRHVPADRMTLGDGRSERHLKAGDFLVLTSDHHFNQVLSATLCSVSTEAKDDRDLHEKGSLGRKAGLDPEGVEAGPENVEEAAGILSRRLGEE